MNTYKNTQYDEERALYGVHGAVIENCNFEGPADGESALKETGDLTINNCSFLLRYPLWHCSTAEINNCSMSETCRAALWYDKDIVINNSELGGIKAVRECDNTTINRSRIVSTEFGWFCRGLKMNSSEIVSEYPFLHTSDIVLDNVNMKGKYSFQYTKNVVIRNSVLDTKDAFWHSENVTVYDSVIKGEYLAWYSKNLRLVRCKIIGTQPLCYADNLIMEECTMTGCDLSFERSDVHADIKGHITSVKNPMSGSIKADHIDELIMDEYARNSSCIITERDKDLKDCV